MSEIEGQVDSRERMVVKKMQKKFLLGIIIYLLISAINFSFAQEENSTERIPILREAKQYRETTVAVDAYLIGNNLEVTVLARMYGTKPKIYNVIVVGPKIGRMSPQTKEILYPTVEEEGLYPMTKPDGFLGLTKKTKMEKTKGTLTKELVKFKIPSDRVISGRRYQLWVKVESLQAGGEEKEFKFELKNLAELLSR